jgi:hypothetical protein
MPASVVISVDLSLFIVILISRLGFRSLTDKMVSISGEHLAYLKQDIGQGFETPLHLFIKYGSLFETKSKKLGGRVENSGKPVD